MSTHHATRKRLFRLEMSLWFLILKWNLRVKCLAYVKHPFFITVIHLVYESIWAWRIPGLWSIHLSLVGWIMGMHCCTDFQNISLQNFKLFWIVLPVWFYAKRNLTMQLLCWSSFIGSLLVSALFLRSYYWHLRRLRTFALIVSVHPYCACKSTFHVMHRARELSIQMNNDRADGHCYSFDWI